jgi:hypothetical protein
MALRATIALDTRPIYKSFGSTDNRGVVIKQIRVFFTTPLLELGEAQNAVLQLGWTARGGDTQSVTFSQSFDDEAAFDSSLSKVKDALGVSRYSTIEFGTIARDQ